MERFSRFVTLSGGKIVKLASVWVYHAGTSTPANIYYDPAGQQAISQPFAPNPDTGEIAFYSVNALIDVVIQAGGIDTGITLRNISMFDPGLGQVLPVWSTATRPPEIPDNVDRVGWNTDLGKLERWTGTTWEQEALSAANIAPGQVVKTITPSGPITADHATDNIILGFDYTASGIFEAFQEFRGGLSIGYPPARSGLLRMPNAPTMVMRNGNNSADITLMTFDTNGNCDLEGALTIGGNNAFTLTTSGTVASVRGTETQGVYGVTTPVLSVSEYGLQDTTYQTVASFTPPVQGNYLVYLYYRVVTGPTLATLVLQWWDSSGRQEAPIVNNTVEMGSYSAIPVMINANQSGPIRIFAQANQANRLYVSLAVLGI